MGAVGGVVSSEIVTSEGQKILQVRVDLGGNDIVTVWAMDAANVDTRPEAGDFGAIVDIEETSGNGAAAGYMDPVEDRLSEPGEFRAYARGDGQAIRGRTVAELWLHTDGSVDLINALGGIKLKANGEIDVNGATITTNGDVITPDGISLRNHTHPYTWTDPGGSGDTGPPT